jgi:hypothetical protein
MFKIIKTIKNMFVEGTVKIKFLAYDDSVPQEQIEPYEDIAVIVYEGEYNEFDIKRKVRQFVRQTKDHLVVESTVIERTENGEIVYDILQDSKEK